ncbi:BLOC-1-related complex subunit 6 [Tetranychus urticae]|uniref:BLOC-1-related complex subunit 6 C-terminal helix domain-containing protein n=1 Tax=Tetranychus urticae TaxID=32264 RepID=T1L427_TETUR|nr:BLOC-1-related complex subunit 6 [Tetranychus urticae]XP_015793619.1 BLOC-1-related complex subunit 6 [Tetranychus urticae]XP_015793620.1 BLOC-1-related complex subunit 6 [Tetranychus urticae]XP_015793621.1 BLOC-1-related complex subunit 6 [Tetranychus urticae]
MSDSDAAKNTEVKPSASGKSPTDDGPCDDLHYDMMTSSYTEISFDESDLEDGIEADDNNGDSTNSADASKNKQIPGSLSLPHLSSTIIDWSERAKAEYEAEFGNTSANKPSTEEKEKLAGNIEYSDDGMITFVAHDLENKLRLSSVMSSPCISSSSDEPSSSNSATLDLNFLSKLESQAQQISKNLDQVMKYIYNYTCQVSSLTLNSVKNFETCLTATCDSVDSNIKLMYQLMAKYEELGSVMSPIEKLADEIKEVKRLLALFEREMETNRYQQ